jgi:hypothetical protein
LNLGLQACKAGMLPLVPYHQSIFLWLFWRRGLAYYLFRLAPNGDPPNLSLTSTFQGVSLWRPARMAYSESVFLKELNFRRS